MEPSLEGKVVLVTGANTGIGEQTARCFARMGATVVLGVRSLKRGEAAAKDIRQCLQHEKGACGTVIVLKGDLADVVDVARFAKAFI